MTTIYYHDVAGKSPRDPNGDPDRCLLCDGTESLNAEDYCPCHFDECDCETCGWREMEDADEPTTE